MSIIFFVSTPKTRFSEILNLMNEIYSSLFHILLFIQTQFSEETQFSEQKGSDNNVH